MSVISSALAASPRRTSAIGESRRSRRPCRPASPRRSTARRGHRGAFGGARRRRSVRQPLEADQRPAIAPSAGTACAPAVAMPGCASARGAHLDPRRSCPRAGRQRRGGATGASCSRRCACAERRRLAGGVVEPAPRRPGSRPAPRRRRRRPPRSRTSARRRVEPRIDDRIDGREVRTGDLVAALDQDAGQVLLGRRIAELARRAPPRGSASSVNAATRRAAQNASSAPHLHVGRRRRLRLPRRRVERVALEAADRRILDVSAPSATG